ncbi:GNAT family N-acetyltransferase [bacterium]|nr:GNAT family N-acetyltransferase [bacterium]
MNDYLEGDNPVESRTDMPTDEESLDEETMLPLRTERTLLRRINVEDAGDLFEIYGDEEDSRYDPNGTLTAEEVEYLIYSQSEIYIGAPGVPYLLAIEEIESGRVIGTINITILSPSDRQGSIGFTLLASFRGQGLATEATRAAIQFGFEHLDLHRITSQCDARNERSWKLMERVGMRREGHFRHDSIEDGQWIDSFFYALLEDEWQPH